MDSPEVLKGAQPCASLGSERCVVDGGVLKPDFCVESVANSSTAAEVVRIVWRLDNRTACTDDRLGCSPRDRDAIMVRRAAS